MTTYISNFVQGIITIKGKGKRKKIIDASISIGDEVKLKGEYYVSEKGAKFTKKELKTIPIFGLKNKDL